ncbi:MAG: acyl carrier protein [Chitinophagia bacterium]|jgi:acyl carrier protein
MDTTKVLQEVNEIFKEVLDDESIVLNYESNSDNIDDWDSLAHIQLIVAIEKKYKIKFTAKEMVSWKNVGEMTENIVEKINC